MGEEERKEEVANKQEGESKREESKELPPPEEIVLRVHMHCEGCARKVRRSLKGLQGIEDVKTDCSTHKLIVKGKNADPLKVLERVQRKISHSQVELLSPIPKPVATKDEKKREENTKKVKPEEKKEEGIVVVLMLHLHCEACAQEIQKRIERIKGVLATEADLKSSQIRVKCLINPPKLVEYVYKRTGKHAVIVKTDPEKKKEEKSKKEKEENAEKDKGGEAEKKGEAKEEEAAKVELKKNELYYYPPKTSMEYIYPPQFFSEENPNSCSVM